MSACATTGARRGPGGGRDARTPLLRVPGRGGGAEAGPESRPAVRSDLTRPCGIRGRRGSSCVPTPVPILCGWGGRAEAGGRNRSSGSPGAGCSRREVAGQRKRLARPQHVPSLDSQGRQELSVGTRGREQGAGAWEDTPIPHPSTLAPRSAAGGSPLVPFPHHAVTF